MELYVVATADNLSYDIEASRCYYTEDDAKNALSELYNERKKEIINENGESFIEEDEKADWSYHIMQTNGDLFYGTISHVKHILKS